MSTLLTRQGVINQPKSSNYNKIILKNFGKFTIMILSWFMEKLVWWIESTTKKFLRLFSRIFLTIQFVFNFLKNLENFPSFQKCNLYIIKTFKKSVFISQLFHFFNTHQNLFHRRPAILKKKKSMLSLIVTSSPNLFSRRVLIVSKQNKVVRGLRAPKEEKAFSPQRSSPSATI